MCRIFLNYEDGFNNLSATPALKAGSSIPLLNAAVDHADHGLHQKYFLNLFNGLKEDSKRCRCITYLMAMFNFY